MEKKVGAMANSISGGICPECGVSNTRIDNKNGIKWCTYAACGYSKKIPKRVKK